MPPAVIAAGVVAAGTIGGAVLSSKSQKSAAAQANDAQQQATQAQLQLGQQSLDLNKQIYNSNYGLLSPFVSNGLAASNNLNALLGLPAGPKLTSPLAAPPPSSAPAQAQAPAQTGPTLAQIQAMQHDGVPGNYQAAMQQYYAAHPADVAALQHDGIPGNYAAATGQKSGGGLLGGLAGLVSPVAGVLGIGGANTSLSKYAASPALALATSGHSSAPAPTAPGQAVPQAAQAAPSAAAGPRPKLSDYIGDHAGFQAAMTAWRSHQAPAAGGTGGSAAGGATSATNALNQFANSAGMKFQLAQGADMINNLYAARGALQSGDAMKAIQNYGQQTALNNYFMPYMGLLQGQQNMGVGAGSAIAGVGSNFGNTAANIYNGMGSSIGNGADAASNAALLRGQINGNMWNSIGGALGNVASSFFPAKY